MFEKYEGLIKGVCTDFGVGYYDLEIKKTQHGIVFCVYITKVGGVNISDCSRVSKELLDLLEKDASLSTVQYSVEVSSPGLERSLKLKKHYLSAINEYLKVNYVMLDTTPDSSEDKKISVSGKLTEVHQDYIVILKESQSKKSDTDCLIQIPFNSIKKAKTYFKEATKENS